MYPHCQNAFAIKQRRKSVDLSPKPCFWASKQLFAIHFLLATCNVCPLTIPEFFAQTWVSDYWQLIHSTICSISDAKCLRLLAFRQKFREREGFIKNCVFQGIRHCIVLLCQVGVCFYCCKRVAHIPLAANRPIL